MSGKLVRIEKTSDSSEKTWRDRISNPNRALRFAHVCDEFLVPFPIGSHATSSDIFAWAVERKFLEPLPANPSDREYRGYLGELHDFIYDMSDSGSHDRRTGQGLPVFCIKSAGRNTWKVYDPIELLRGERQGKRIQSAMRCRSKEMQIATDGLRALAPLYPHLALYIDGVCRQERYAEEDIQKAEARRAEQVLALYDQIRLEIKTPTLLEKASNQ